MINEYNNISIFKLTYWSYMMLSVVICFIWWNLMSFNVIRCPLMSSIVITWHHLTFYVTSYDNLGVDTNGYKLFGGHLKLVDWQTNTLAICRGVFSPKILTILKIIMLCGGEGARTPSFILLGGGWLRNHLFRTISQV